MRAAKREGLPVTCEVTPHHMLLTEDDIADDYPTALKVNPPLRTAADAAALVEGLADGSIDCIVTDHAPHADWEKDREFELAPFGMVGLETSLALVLTKLVHEGVIGYDRLVWAMAANPRKLLGQEPVTIAPGSTADFTVFDPAEEWTVERDGFCSKAGNSGFLGWKLKGRATDVYVGGYATMEEGRIIE